MISWMFVLILSLFTTTRKQRQRHPPTRRPRYYTLLPPRIQAFDTETCRGNLLVICSPTHQFVYNWDNPGSIYFLLEWLWKNAQDTNFFYNLKFDRGSILKPLAKRFKRGQRKVRCGRFLIRLLGNKSFSIKTVGGTDRNGSHHTKRFFDISTFFTDDDGIPLALERVSQIYLCEGKLQDVDRKRLGSEPGYFEEHRAEVVRYCKRDAELTYRLAKIVIGEVYETFKIYPSRWYSKASIAKAWAEHYHPELFVRKPRFRRYASLFRDTYKGGIFATPVLGRVPNVVEEDITSAYGSNLARLPRLDRLGKPTLSNEYHPEALLGAYKILIDYDGKLPLENVLRDKKRGTARVLLPNSHGELRPYYATKAEMDYFVSQGRRFKVLIAEEYFGPYEPQFPEMPAILDKIADFKKHAKHGDVKARLTRHMFKIVINCLYGALGERKFGETDLTTWPLSAHATALTRVDVCRRWAEIEQNGGLVVSVNTDSIRYVPKIASDGSFSIAYERGYGKFEPKIIGKVATHYQSGVAIIEDAGPCIEEVREDGSFVPCGKTGCHDPLLRRRGYGKNLTAELLRTAKGSKLVVPIKDRPVGFYQGIAQHRPEDINDFQDSETTLNLETNRFAFDFGPDELTFETLNSRPVIGRNPDFDTVTNFIYVGKPKRGMR